MFHENSTAEYFKYRKIPERFEIFDLVEFNKSASLLTTNKDAGFHGILRKKIKRVKSCPEVDYEHLTIIIHPSQELPDRRHRSFNIQYLSFSRVTLEPQIKITDETILGLDVDEYELIHEFLIFLNF